MPHPVLVPRRFLEVNTESASTMRDDNEFYCDATLLLKNNWPRVKCGFADISTGKMRIKTADVKSGCVGKMRRCG